MMIIKIIFVIVTWLPPFLIACPTIIDGWTFQFKPDVDTVIQGKLLNSQFSGYPFIYSNTMFVCLRVCMLVAYLLRNGWTDLAKLFFVSSVLVTRWF